MKAMLFTLGGVTAMLVIAVMSGLQFKKPEKIYEDQPHSMKWTRLHARPDGSMFYYTWFDSTGLYPYTRDTCCLDSVEIELVMIGDTMWYVPCE